MQSIEHSYSSWRTVKLTIQNGKPELKATRYDNVGEPAFVYFSSFSELCNDEENKTWPKLLRPHIRSTVQ